MLLSGTTIAVDSIGPSHIPDFAASKRAVLPYTSNWGEEKIGVVDLRTMPVVKRLPTESKPRDYEEHLAPTSLANSSGREDEGAIDREQPYRQYPGKPIRYSTILIFSYSTKRKM
jgi:hypothetical protein